MKAARWYGAKDIRVEAADKPFTGENQVKIDVKFAGICGSDLHEYAHGPLSIPVDKPYPLSGHQGVTTLGHEFSGIVSEIGSNVKNVLVGDRVTIEPIYKYREQALADKDGDNRAVELGFVGLTSNGGFADQVVVEDYMVHKIPDTLSFEKAALVEPTAVAVQAVLKSGLQIGQTVFISGAGPIGLLCCLAAIAAGASTVIISDISEQRLAKAKEIGADHVINASDKNITEKVKNITSGGADVFIDAAGVQASFSTGMASLKIRGTAVMVAVFKDTVVHDVTDQVLREIKIVGTTAYRNIYPQVIALIESGKIPSEKLVTSTIAIDDIVSNGFDVLISNPNEVKILIDLSIK